MANEISDCKYAGKISATGMIWCGKKDIYVTGAEKETCEFYEKE